MNSTAMTMHDSTETWEGEGEDRADQLLSLLAEMSEGTREELSTTHLSSEAEFLPLLPLFSDKKTLVLDLDETLVHSSVQPLENPDFVFAMKNQGKEQNIYVLKRPGVEHFLDRMAQSFEIIVFTASLPDYAGHLLDLLDIHHCVSHRLFREHCVLHKGTYVKDLSKLGRAIENVVIVDNSPDCYSFQKENAVPINSWFSDKCDSQLRLMSPLLEKIGTFKDVREGIEKCQLSKSTDYLLALLRLQNKNRKTKIIYSSTRAGQRNCSQLLLQTESKKTRESAPIKPSLLINQREKEGVKNDYQSEGRRLPVSCIGNENSGSGSNPFIMEPTPESTSPIFVSPQAIPIRPFEPNQAKSTSSLFDPNLFHSLPREINNRRSQPEKAGIIATYHKFSKDTQITIKGEFGEPAHTTRLSLQHQTAHFLEKGAEKNLLTNRSTQSSVGSLQRSDSINSSITYSPLSDFLKEKIEKYSLQKKPEVSKRNAKTFYSNAVLNRRIENSLP